MKPWMPWALLGAVLVVCASLLVAIAQQPAPAFIPGDQPVTEEQVRTKMQAEGWSNVQIAHEGRILQVIGSKDGETRRMAVDSQTGRFAQGDDDDDD